MEWEYLRNLKVKNNPFINDNFYDIRYTESFKEGVTSQFLDDIETFFEEESLEISIRYNEKNIIKAFMVLIVRITDDSFKYNEVVLKGDRFILKNKKEEEIFNSLWQNFINSDGVVIKVYDLKNFEYAKGVVTYEITQDYEDSYFLNKELARWNCVELKEKS